MENSPLKTRLDSLLVKKNLVDTRQRAQALIMAGRVFVNGEKHEKPGREVSADCSITITEDLPFVSRGGLKLQAAIQNFGVNLKGASVLDAGASTGGFTDCLLQHGAARVLAVDVGYGQFAWKLRSDPRVTLIERTNIRYFDKSLIPFALDAVVADLSFISLKLVLETLRDLVPVGAWMIVLVKPQFEVGREAIEKGGVVRSRSKMMSAVESVKKFASGIGMKPTGLIESPIKGPKGNTEFLLHLVRLF
jgi:23S rRNA (cytidine1920-2'-O)/16S rRNA (cytidine1409-2'-O)-methyltransferase